MAGNQRPTPFTQISYRALSTAVGRTQNRFDLRLVICGLGSIGIDVARAVQQGKVPGVVLTAAVEPTVSPNLEQIATVSLPVHDGLTDLDWASTDVVLEAASQTALRSIGPRVLEQGVDLVALSAGATLDSEFMATLVSSAQESGSRVWFPSGALGGLDVVRAANVGTVHSIMLTTTKPPHAFTGAPYVVEQHINLAGLTTRLEIFSGDAVTAVRGFPNNVNVAALLVLAAGDPDRVRVTIVADPDASDNVHEVEVSGTFGNMHIRLKNKPSATNPKTSALASQSVIALLRQLGAPLRFA